MRNRIVVGLLAAAAFAVAAPAANAQSGDVGGLCDSVLGSGDSTINLSPLANINIKTCLAAQAPTCAGGGSPMNISLLPLANINIRIC